MTINKAMIIIVLAIIVSTVQAFSQTCNEVLVSAPYYNFNTLNSLTKYSLVFRFG